MMDLTPFRELIAPVKLNTIGSMRLLRLKVAFETMAEDILDLVPDSEKQEQAVADLLIIRKLCMLAILDGYAASPMPAPKEKKDAPKTKKHKS